MPVLVKRTVSRWSSPSSATGFSFRASLRHLECVAGDLVRGAVQLELEAICQKLGEHRPQLRLFQIPMNVCLGDDVEAVVADPRRSSCNIPIHNGIGTLHEKDKGIASGCESAAGAHIDGHDPIVEQILPDRCDFELGWSCAWARAAATAITAVRPTLRLGTSFSSRLDQT